ncbi:hypothetical protein BS50DRAFT_193078 [Corynespora cassiicola Philippines]|uniref:Uncharacterized protein n=1 Tax=Corynespora cassiicola Philippines TaxID=1448308 RepID=A0A2T2P7P3_CORCC|nr:hypothetical protein BS50DRAFT_193078 [Corynespora cassiicola Philippines]
MSDSFANSHWTDDQIFSPEEEASINVDALVNDSDFEPLGRGTPINSHRLDPPRRATPTIPPGFTAPVVPKPMIDDHASRPMSRTTSSTLPPAVPVMPITPIRAATPVKSKKEKQPVDTKEAQSAKVAEPVATPKIKPEMPSKPGRKPSSGKTQSGAEAAKGKVENDPLVDQKESRQKESPVKATPKSKTSLKKLDATPQKDMAFKEFAAVAAATPASSKRQHPGKLDIAAATKAPENEPPTLASLLKSDAPSKGLRNISLSTNSVPPSPVITPASTPAATSTGSPVKRSAPRTIRVVPTPKTEVPPPLSAVSATSVPHVPTVEKLRSRQASIASLNQPGTPASELVSDTASITSTSISRANSPPPIGGKVGTAPVRKKTKSQAKKERQERKRQITEEQEMALDEPNQDEEPVQAPIVGRKKKTKKPAQASVPTPTPAPAPTPLPLDTPKNPTVEEEEDTEIVEPKPGPVAVPKKASTLETTIQFPQKPQLLSLFESIGFMDQAKEKRELSPQAIIADLQKTGELRPSELEFFKPPPSSFGHASRTYQSNVAAVTPPDLKIHFSEADLDALTKKKPVRLNGQDGKPESRTLITPQGKFLWGLSPEDEERVLELEKRIENSKGQARFHPRRQTAHSNSHNASPQTHSKDVLPAIATALKEAGAKLNRNAASSPTQPMPKLDPTATLLGSTSLPLPPVQASSDVPAPSPQPQPQSQASPETMAFLNQFVLPKTDNPSPNTPRSEMAAVGGPPGAGLANISVNVNKIAKAAKAAAEGGLSTEVDGMGVITKDRRNGVWVQSLEAFMSAGLGFHSSQDANVYGQGNVTLFGNGLDVQGLTNVVESGGGLSGFGGAFQGQNTRRSRQGLLSLGESEQSLHSAKKDNEAMEKKFMASQKRNKKILNGVGKF